MNIYVSLHIKWRSERRAGAAAPGARGLGRQKYQKWALGAKYPRFATPVQFKNPDQDILVQYSNEVTIRNNFRTVHRAPEKTLKGALTK